MRANINYYSTVGQRRISTHDENNENYYCLMGIKEIELVSSTGHKFMIEEDENGNLKVID